MGFEYLGLLFIVSSVLCLVGFYKYSYFTSVGYGFAVAGIGISLIMLCLMKQFRAETPHYIMFALLVIYGFCKAWFLLIRDKNLAELQALKETMAKEKKISIVTKVVAWLLVSVLYVVQASPLFFSVKNGGFASGWTIVGIIISVIGILAAIVGDLLVRRLSPLGEMLFWTGVLVSSLDALQGFGQWALALIGYLYIGFFIFNKVKRSGLSAK
jgi:hypothetical protein